MHLRGNVPGVLAAANVIFADHQVNVEGQSLGDQGGPGESWATS
ncbi:MAG: hypothetical protein ACRDY0_05640 [Acidimicrobiales bacterium]